MESGFDVMESQTNPYRQPLLTTPTLQSLLIWIVAHACVLLQSAYLKIHSVLAPDVHSTSSTLYTSPSLADPIEFHHSDRPGSTMTTVGGGSELLSPILIGSLLFDS
jgi:hypothetical protein